MEKKTNKKIRNFHIFEKIGLIARQQPLIKLAEIVPSMEIQSIYTY